MKSILILLSLFALTQASSQATKDKCFEKSWDGKSWICTYKPQKVRPNFFRTRLLAHFELESRDPSLLRVRVLRNIRKVIIETSNENLAKAIKAKISEWDDNTDIIVTQPTLKMKFDYYVISETKMTDFKLGISKIEKGVKEAANSEASGEDESGNTGADLTKAAVGLLISGSTGGVTAAISKGLDNFSLLLSRGRVNSSMRHHRSHQIENADGEYFQFKDLAPKDITAPTNLSNPQIIEIGVKVEGRMILNGGDQSKLVYVPFMDFTWTRVDDIENNIYPKFETSTPEQTWILGVPKFIATAEINEFSSNKNSNFLSFEKGSGTVKKKLAIVATVYQEDDPSLNNNYIDHIFYQKKELTKEEIKELPTKNVSCEEIEKSIQLKAFRDNFGQAKLMLKLSPSILSQDNYNNELEISSFAKRARSRRSTKNPVLKDIAYNFQEIYEVVPETEGKSYIELRLNFKSGKQCKFKKKAAYNVENGDFRLK